MEQNTRKLVNYIIWEIAIFLILLIAVVFLDRYLPEDTQESLRGYLPKAIIIALILVITKIILTFIKPAFEKTMDRHARSHAETKMVWQLISNIAWIAIIVLIILIIVGDLTGLLTFGVVVAALLWVLQKPILNIAGWMQITFRRPFTIGDRIEIDGRKGYVVDVGMFQTTVREFGEWMHGDTFTGRLVQIPNSSVFEKPIINYTRETPYIWDEIKISITYESDHAKVKQIILDIAQEVVGKKMKTYSEKMAQKMDIRELRRQLIEGPVVMMEFSESSVDFFAIYLCDSSQRRAIKTEIIEKILIEIKKNNKVKIAYPHVEVKGMPKK